MSEQYGRTAIAPGETYASNALHPVPAPRTNLGGAIDAVDKANAELADKIDLLCQRLAFVTQPEQPGIATNGHVGRSQAEPRSEAVHRLDGTEERLLNLAARIDGYLARLEV